MLIGQIERQTARWTDPSTLWQMTMKPKQTNKKKPYQKALESDQQQAASGKTGTVLGELPVHMASSPRAILDLHQPKKGKTQRGCAPYCVYQLCPDPQPIPERAGGDPQQRREGFQCLPTGEGRALADQKREQTSEFPQDGVDEAQETIQKPSRDERAV